MEMKQSLAGIDEAKMKTVIQLKNDYNTGKISLADAKRILKEKVGTLKPYEIALAEQELKTFRKCSNSLKMLWIQAVLTCPMIILLCAITAKTMR